MNFIEIKLRMSCKMLIQAKKDSSIWELEIVAKPNLHNNRLKTKELICWCIDIIINRYKKTFYILCQELLNTKNLSNSTIIRNHNFSIQRSANIFPVWKVLIIRTCYRRNNRKRWFRNFSNPNAQKIVAKRTVNATDIRNCRDKWVPRKDKVLWKDR